MNCSYRGLRSCKNDASYGMLCDKHANKCKACGHPTVQKFCVEHECPSRECHERVERDSRSCASHRCVAAECSEVKNSIPNIATCTLAQHAVTHCCSDQDQAQRLYQGMAGRHAARHRCQATGTARNTYVIFPAVMRKQDLICRTVSSTCADMLIISYRTKQQIMHETKRRQYM